MANPIRHRKEVEELARILDEKRLTEIEYEAGDFAFESPGRARRSHPLPPWRRNQRCP